MKPGPLPMPGRKDKEEPDSPGQAILHSRRQLCYSIMDSELLQELGNRIEDRADRLPVDFR